jgi:tetratricopeptide (TPR) repeat protein
MKASLFTIPALLFLVLPSCGDKTTAPSKEAIRALRLKTGRLITCGPPDKEFGSVTFPTSCTGEAARFNLAMELLHSFEYDEAEKVFAGIIDSNPACAMAYWGVAMSNFHPLWAPPTQAELTKGARALSIARSIKQKSTREQDYIDALSAFYGDWDKVDHRSRCLRFEKAMEGLRRAYPDDKETAVFYALSLTAAADPADKTLSRQKKAGAILTALYRQQPDHPGIVHYLIHAYDYPELAQLALPAARRYAAVAPSSAHALHMPSHIFTRLGLWDECIRSNLVSVSAARCYAEAAGIRGHWDEELHGMDYLVYAYLQKGEMAKAKEQWDELRTIDTVYPVNFKVAYAFAAIPSRYALENRLWKEAAGLPLHPARFPWKDYLWQEAILHFTRLMGAVHTARIDSAKAEWSALNRIYGSLVKEKDDYKANQVLIQLKTGGAWIKLGERRIDEALADMALAADMEDRTEKHPVTPCEVLPARELLGDMYLELSRAGKALEAYEADLVKHPNRFNGLFGAGLAARQAGQSEKAQAYFRQLLSIADPASPRPELTTVRYLLRD